MAKGGSEVRLGSSPGTRLVTYNGSAVEAREGMRVRATDAVASRMLGALHGETART